MREDADVIEDSHAAPLRNSCNLIGAQLASCTADCTICGANFALYTVPWTPAAYVRATGKDGLVLDVNNVLISIYHFM